MLPGKSTENDILIVVSGTACTAVFPLSVQYGSLNNNAELYTREEDRSTKNSTNNCQ